MADASAAAIAPFWSHLSSSPTHFLPQSTHYHLPPLHGHLHVPVGIWWPPAHGAGSSWLAAGFVLWHITFCVNLKAPKTSGTLVILLSCLLNISALFVATLLHVLDERPKDPTFKIKSCKPNQYKPRTCTYTHRCRCTTRVHPAS